MVHNHSFCHRRSGIRDGLGASVLQEEEDEEEEEEGGGNSLLSLELSRLELGNKVFDCLLCEVRAHVAGEGPVGVALVCSSVNKQNQFLDLQLIFQKHTVTLKNIIILKTNKYL